MSLVLLRVELPAYSHSFNVQIPSSATVRDIKQEIFRLCPGNPRVDGQRLVWRGRYLADDERMDDLWKSPDEPRIVHVAVHPSAWSSAPPSIGPVSSISSSGSETTSGPLSTMPPPNVRTIFDRLHSVSSPEGNAMEFIQWKHDNALCALMYGWTNSWHHAFNIQTSRSLAVSYVHSRGYEWPTVLDEEFPAPTTGGVKYEYKTIDGLPYLSLSDSTSSATPFQLHAIRVLSFTFTLLSLNLAPTSTTRPIAVNAMPANTPPELNALLQQLGLPTLRVQQPQLANNNNNDNPERIFRELREIAVRPLLASLIFLLLRTCLLLYFVAPARKPVFGMLILAWMLYEIWQPMRNAFLRNLQRLDGQQRNVAQGGANPPGGDRQQQGQQPQRAAAAPRANEPVGVPRVNDGGTLFDALGNMNLDGEQRVLDVAPGTALEEPSFWRKSMIFMGLLITTLHPAVWNRRRMVLQRREGQLRTEENARNEEGEDRMEVRNAAQAQHGRRPQWVRGYVERVLATDWLED